MKVLIVDDELLVRIGVKTILEGIGVPMEIRTAADGKEALDIFHIFQPDLVFVDINMPRLYGFDFIRIAKQRALSVKFVVLTCYNDVTNIQTAVRLGVSDYIIKTELDRRTITRLVYECMGGEEAESETASQEKPIHSKALQVTEQAGIETIQKEAEKEFQGERFVVIYIYPQKIYAGKQEKFEMIVSDLLEGIISDYGKGQLYRQPDGAQLITFSFSPRRPDQNVELMLASELGQQIADSMRTYFNEEYSIGISFCSDTFRFAQIAEKAREYARQYFYHPETSVFICREVENDLAREMPKGVWEHIKRNLDYKEYEEAEITFEKFTEELVENRPGNIDAVISKLFDLFYLVLFHVQQNYPHLLFQQYWEMDYRAFFLEQNRLDSYSSKIRELLKMLREEGAARAAEHGNKGIVERAKVYIEKHLEEGFDLQTVSAYVNLSASHFTRIFKETEGVTFIDYCMERRIKRAKSYIDAGDKIFVAAEKVGYQNYSYFSKVFKRVTGLTPENYRKQQNRKQNN